MSEPRSADPRVEPLFLERWSPRAFDASVLPDEDLMVIFDAARWAPSAYNLQPWRFLYAKREDADFARLLDLLVPFNRSWAENASVIILVASDTLVPGPEDQAPRTSHSHSFDAGAAWAVLALQARRMGYDTHGMTGVDFAKARAALEVPDRFRLEAAIALGRRGDKASLPEALQGRETPSGRHPVESFAFRGGFPVA
jgi:nitroreductase